jgi:peptidoglycan hydrolase-like protein with peptidoglycan-binding domain
VNAHSKPRQHNPLRLSLAGAGILGLVIGITFALHEATSGGSAGATAITAKNKPATVQADTRTGATSTLPAPTTTLPGALPTVTSISPAGGATSVAPDAPITIKFSTTVVPGSPEPTISPAAMGSWRTAGSTMTFVPAAGWVPYSTVTVTVPGASEPTSSIFVVAAGSPLRLQQLLAVLGYLPVSFAPTGSTAGDALADQPTSAAEVPTFPVPGSFTWTYATTPPSLTAQWNQNAFTVITKGAVMAFENAHNMVPDGTPGPAVWNALLRAVATHAASGQPYNYLMVSESEPESLQVWSKGAVVATTLVNTGAPGAATEQGTFPVFEHLLVTTMIGTNPDGSRYDDPGIRWVAYFNGGDAVHQYYRYSYGWPQSNGCVELPSTTAETVWGYDPIGTLVTVS